MHAKQVIEKPRVIESKVSPPAVPDDTVAATTTPVLAYDLNTVQKPQSQARSPKIPLILDDMTPIWAKAK